MRHCSCFNLIAFYVNIEGGDGNDDDNYNEGNRPTPTPQILVRFSPAVDPPTAMFTRDNYSSHKWSTSRPNE